MTVDRATVGRIFREESGRSVATLIRILGDIDRAEDAVQEAFTVALRTWPERGVPANPGGWITTTARNRAIDRLRRERRGRELMDEVVALAEPPSEADQREEVGGVEDDRLRLVFTCCHPALAPPARIALTLRLLGGLTTAEVARAFLVSESTMAQRLVRAKHKIAAARIPYRVPEDHDLPDRLAAVLTVLYLIYNAGTEGDADLRPEALRLTRVLRELMPDEVEVLGLLALLLLTEARRSASRDARGRLVLLRDQDRASWDRSLVDEGLELVRTCLRRDRAGPFQLQAAINAVHVTAPTAADTDWGQIVTLYDQLRAMTPTPVVELNRAIALAEIEGPGPALDIVERLALDGYPAWHATMAHLLRAVGRRAEADRHYGRAAELAVDPAQAAWLREQVGADASP